YTVPDDGLFAKTLAASLKRNDQYEFEAFSRAGSVIAQARGSRLAPELRSSLDSRTFCFKRCPVPPEEINMFERALSSANLAVVEEFIATYPGSRLSPLAHQFKALLQASGPNAISPVLEGLVFQSSGHAALDEWRDGFAKTAAEEGFSQDLIRQLLNNIEPLDMFLGPEGPRTKAQPTSSLARSGDPPIPLVFRAKRATENLLVQVQSADYAKPISDYLRSAVSRGRISSGQIKADQNGAVLKLIEGEFGLPYEILVAIWGMQTNYGDFTGEFDAPEVLANMAAEGRRRTFAENELRSLLSLLGNGTVKREQLTSGWSGTMGQAQMLPSTLLEYGRDGDGDGEIDIWTSQADALYSIANILRGSWSPNVPWGFLVTIDDRPGPEYFELFFSGARPLSAWRDLGVQWDASTDAEGLDDIEAELWAPIGVDGAAFLLTSNFDVIKTYNRADGYALSVALLGDAIKSGDTEIEVALEPVHPQVPRSMVKKVQAQLNAAGCEAGPTDGVIGRDVRRAIARYQASAGLVADGILRGDTLDALSSGDMRCL
ncbi:MAG: lytic murein transglycosylase, partial [Pseudomonadota bacterium]